MTTVGKIDLADYKEIGEMLRYTVMTSFKDLYPETLRKAISEKYDPDEFLIRAEKTNFFIAKEGATIVGCIGLEENRVRTFYVHPDFQGKGIGRLLYATIEEIAREYGHKSLYVVSSPLGIPIYEHFGFVKIKPVEKERAGQKYVDMLMEKIFI